MGYEYIEEWESGCKDGTDRTALVVLFALCTACRPSVTVQAPGKLDVRVTEMPARAGCYLPEMPQPPSLIELNFEDDDIIHRTSLHYLQGNEIIQYEQHIHEWAKQVRDCLFTITGQEP